MPTSAASATGGALPSLSDLLLDDPTDPPRWAFRSDNSGLDTLADAMGAAAAIGEARRAYWAMQALSVLFVALRFFRNLGFHGKLGLVTNSVRRALPELFDFAVVGALTLFALGLLLNVLLGCGTCGSSLFYPSL